MLVHPVHADRYLIELRDLETEPAPAPVTRHRAPLERIVDWAHSYLSRPHPMLGRTGPVCPFVPAALRKGSFLLTVHDGPTEDRAALLATILLYRDWFLALEPRTGSEAFYKTILILFPEITEEQRAEAIDRTQEDLKPQYVAEGLMIGEFHQGPPGKPGLWNPDFRPLRSPVPLLAIRHMVATDFYFLRGERRFLAPYLERYGDRLPPHLIEPVRQAAAAWGLPLPAPGPLLPD